MSEPKTHSAPLADPEPGDVFAVIELFNEGNASSFLATLGRRLMGKRALPAPYSTIHYRLVISVSPTTILFQDNFQEELFAAWKNEWYDWQAESYQLAERGVPLPADQLQAITGQRAIPFTFLVLTTSNQE